MKMIEVLTIASLFMLPGAIAPAYAQGRGEEKQPEQKQQQAKPAQPQAKPAPQEQRAQQQAKPAQPQQRAQQEAKPAQPQLRAQQEAKPAQPQQRAQQQAKPAQPQQRAQQQAKPAPQQQANRAQPAAGHGSIPADRFRASFGRGHTFHVSRSDFSGGSRRFQYGGFWFAMVNPWPVAWLYTDDVYVDYMNGGYFLCDPVHPGVYLSITVG
jgi:outer membrane biosynthesis protein TonB